MHYLVNVDYFVHDENYVYHPSTRRNHMEVDYWVKQFYTHLSHLLWNLLWQHAVRL